MSDNVSSHAETVSVPSTDEVDVSVVIVNYNVSDFLAQALRSIFQSDQSLKVEVLVVDNNSIDGSVDMVRDQFPQVHLIANTENTGFGSANNQAIRIARGRHILILNPDTIIQEDTLKTMVRFMDEHPDAGALGCQILNPDGTFAPESRRSFPTPKIAFYRMIGLGRLFPSSPRFGKYNLTYLPRDQASEVDALSGSCMMVRRKALFGANEEGGSGLFDEDFFMYGEDLDLCFRIQEAGWKVWYTPETWIIHYKGESTKKGEIRYVKLFYGAMLLFIEKHMNGSQSSILTSMLRAGIMVRAGMSVIMNGIRRALPPFMDFAAVYLSVATLGTLRWIQTDISSSTLFFLTTALAYPIATVLGIAIGGGYRNPNLHRIGPALSGVIGGFFFVASLSYFVQDIAFSRWVVGLSLPVSFVFLAIWRGIIYRRRRGPRRAVLVGNAPEASRLARLLAGHPRPPFTLLGYVSDDSPLKADTLCLGRTSHLRDLVRLRGFDDIVFAAQDVSNQSIFSVMRSLEDLSVQFRMLHEGQEHVIGKSSISQVSVGSLKSEFTEVVQLRSSLAKTVFERSLSLVLLPLLPFIWLISRMFAPESNARNAAFMLLHTPLVLIGKAHLIGCRKEDVEWIPASWNIDKGLFPVTNTMRTKELNRDEIVRAYWYYVTHQGYSLDLDIILASFRND